MFLFLRMDANMSFLFTRTLIFPLIFGNADIQLIYLRFHNFLVNTTDVMKFCYLLGLTNIFCSVLYQVCAESLLCE